jgi:CheY-like chemotaxis protein
MTAPKKLILCVEDHPETCPLVAAALPDYEVVSAHSMEAGLRQATGEHFDLHLFDYHLPDGTGLQLCLFIRTFDKNTPILLWSGVSSITEQHVTTAGAQGLINKGPDFIDKLEEAIQQLLAPRT